MTFSDQIIAASDFLAQGGFVLWLLAGLSVLTLTVALYKFLQLAPHAMQSTGLARKLALDQGAELAIGQASVKLGALRSGLGLLELLFNIAPLLGLLGTILGMIEAFQALEAAGNSVSPSQLAGGIWTALLTTAAGLVVAMLALVCLNSLEAMLEAIKRKTEKALNAQFSAHDTAHAAP